MKVGGGLEKNMWFHGRQKKIRQESEKDFDQRTLSIYMEL